jgi:hypothetical protein
MIKELNFEEIDQMMEEMGGNDNITSAIAADVAKVDDIIKKTPAKTAKAPAAKKKPIVKKAAAKTPATKSTVAKKSSPKKPSAGEAVDVKILTKTQPVETKTIPNPKTGKFMDIVSPLSDMSIQGKRPTKGEEPTKEVAEVEVITSSTVVATIDDEPESEDLLSELEELTVDETDLDDKPIETEVDQPASEAESEPEVEPESELKSEIEPDLPVEENEESEILDDEDMALGDILDNLEGMSDDTGLVPDDPGENLENLADIVDIPDHSEAFLENVEIEKRPLGGGESVVSSVGSASVEKVVNFGDDAAEEVADQEFIKDKPTPKWLESKPKVKSSQPVADSKTSKKPAKLKPPKVAKKGSATLYVVLIILILILGGAAGALAYFSGLF